MIICYSRTYTGNIQETIQWLRPFRYSSHRQFSYISQVVTLFSVPTQFMPIFINILFTVQRSHFTGYHLSFDIIWFSLLRIILYYLKYHLNGYWVINCTIIFYRQAEPWETPIHQLNLKMRGEIIIIDLSVSVLRRDEMMHAIFTHD